MKNVRIWFKKVDACKYISHLDLNRTMTRAIRRAEVPLWYTEGFNPHPFITFPLPISLGIDGISECMDIRIVEEAYDLSQIPEKMNKYLPDGIRVFKACEPKLDAKYIAYAKYTADFSCDSISNKELFESIKGILDSAELVIEKKTKAGMKDIDLLPHIKDLKLSDWEESIKMDITLPAGNTTNIGLTLLIKAIEKYLGHELNYSMTRHRLLTEEMKPFE